MNQIRRREKIEEGQENVNKKSNKEKQTTQHILSSTRKLGQPWLVDSFSNSSHVRFFGATKMGF